MARKSKVNDETVPVSEVDVNEIEMSEGVNEDLDFDVSEESMIPMKEVKIERTEEEEEVKQKKNVVKEKKPLVSCLRNERVIVRFLNHDNGVITNPNHVLFGGMAENSMRTFVVPKLSSGTYVNVLTDDEKDFLEEYMGLEPNALSVYKKKDNFWDDDNENGVTSVTLRKQDNYLDLSIAEDYIRYKILLANKDYVAPSMKAYEDCPKATYQFVIIAEEDEFHSGKATLTTNKRCYAEFGKIENDAALLRTVIELIEGRPVSKTSKLEWLQVKADNLIQANGKLFLKVVTDPMLKTKALIKRAVESGIIFKKGDYHYTKQDGNVLPLCENGEEPTFNVTAKFLNLPKNQELKFSIEARIK